jgi:hypothetical protein
MKQGEKNGAEGSKASQKNFQPSDRHDTLLFLFDLKGETYFSYCGGS